MAVSLTKTNEINYLADDSIHEKFFHNLKFCSSLQNYAQRLLSISIVIIPHQSSEIKWNTEKSIDGCTIQLPNTTKNREELGQTISNLIKNVFQSIQSKVFQDDKVKEWLHHQSTMTDYLKCLQKILDEKVSQVFTVCDDDIDSSLRVYYLPREPFSLCHSEEIDTIIPNKILQETIVLPLESEQSNMFKSELEKLNDEKIKKGEVSVTFVNPESKSKKKRQEIVLFGYYRIVNRWKQEFLKIIEKYQLLTWKFQSLNPFQIDFLRATCTQKLHKIEQKYSEVGVKLRLQENEFLSPGYLREEIASRITKLLAHSITTTFHSTQLSQAVAEHANRHLKSLVHRNYCNIQTELEYQSRFYTIPKAISSSTQISKSILKQSDHFRRSMEVSHGIIVNNGFIEIRTGDIALQKRIIEWSTAAIKVTLMTPDAEISTKYQQKIENYLKRCTTSLKIIHPNKFFEHWNQPTINAFYKYCQDQCVLPHINKTGNKIELIGPINNILQVEQKLFFLSMNSVIIREQFKIHNIMISVCHEDKRLSQPLVNRLIEEGFSVWVEPIHIEQQRDVNSQIDKADCIILCISEHSYRSQSSEKEANYAYQTNKLVIPVKIQNYALIGWQREVFDRKISFQLFGSESHFDFEFGRIFIEILRQTKSTYISAFQRKSDQRLLENDQPRFRLTTEEQRSKHDTTIRRLKKRGRISDEEMKSLIKQLQNVIDDISGETEKENSELSELKQRKRARTSRSKYWNSEEELVCCAKRWLQNPTNITKQNLPPFSTSGDINDAPFPIPQDLFDNRERDFRTFLPSAFGINEQSIVRIPPRVSTGPIPIDDECVYGLCTPKAGYEENLFQVFSETHCTDDFIPRKGMSAPHWSLIAARRPIEPTRRTAVTSWKSTRTERKHRVFHQRLRTKDKDAQNREPRRTYGGLSPKEYDACRKKFAQRMQENNIEFEKFCSTYVKVQ